MLGSTAPNLVAKAGLPVACAGVQLLTGRATGRLFWTVTWWVEPADTAGAAGLRGSRLLVGRNAGKMHEWASSVTSESVRLARRDKRCPVSDCKGGPNPDNTPDRVPLRRLSFGAGPPGERITRLCVQMEYLGHAPVLALGAPAPPGGSRRPRLGSRCVVYSGSNPTVDHGSVGCPPVRVGRGGRHSDEESHVRSRHD